MLNRVGRVAAAVTVSAAIAASCGTADPQESAPPTTTQSPVLSTPSTPPVTDPPATTTPPPTTSPAPETTSPEAVEQEVINAYLAAWNAYHAAAAEPANLALRTAVEASTTGPNLELSRSVLDALVDRGWAARPNPSAPAHADVISAVSFLDEARTLAQMVVCERNNELVVEVGAAPDGGDAVVNDDVAAREIRLTMALVDGAWMSQTGETLEVHYGAQECTAG